MCKYVRDFVEELEIQNDARNKRYELKFITASRSNVRAYIRKWRSHGYKVSRAAEAGGYSSLLLK